MNITLWAFQVALAVRTACGAVWKFSHTAAQTMPSIKAIPNGAWKTMAVTEILLAAGLVIPALGSPFGTLAPCAATAIGGEMLLLSGVHLRSGSKRMGPSGYGLVMAAASALLSYRRFVPKPF